MTDGIDPIARDAPCRTCGYNLRGLDGSARCPECGRAAAESPADDSLRFADPAWLRTVAGGCRLAVWATAVAAVALLGGIVLNAVRPSFYALGAAAAVARAFAAWRLTTPDPSGLGESDYGIARRAARVLLLVAGFASVLPLAGLSNLPAPLPTVAASLEAAGYLAFVTGVAATMRYLSGLMLRVPDVSAGRAWLLQWALPTSFALILAPTTAFYFLTPARRAASAYLPMLALLGLVTLSAFGLMALALLARVARLLRGEARRAEDHRVLVAARLKTKRATPAKRAGV